MASAVHSEDIDMIGLAADIWRAKLFVVAVVGVFIVASVYMALTATPKFAAEVVVTQVDDASMSSGSSLVSQLGGLGGLAGLNFGSVGGTHESEALLESRQMAETFIQRYDLVDTLIPLDGERKSLWWAVKMFREEVLQIRPDNEDGTVTVSVLWKDPDTAATWANDYVSLANESIRSRAIAKAERNIEFLNAQVELTSDVDLRRVMYELVQNETKTLMLANARPDYAFAVIDPAIAPEVRKTPRRKLMVISGAFLGAIAGLVSLLGWRLITQVRAAL